MNSLLSWFLLATRFSYYIPGSCVTKQLLIFNVLRSFFEKYENVVSLSANQTTNVFVCYDNNSYENDDNDTKSFKDRFRAYKFIHQRNNTKFFFRRCTVSLVR